MKQPETISKIEISDDIFLMVDAHCSKHHMSVDLFIEGLINRELNIEAYTGRGKMLPAPRS